MIRLMILLILKLKVYLLSFRMYTGKIVHEIYDKETRGSIMSQIM